VNKKLCNADGLCEFMKDRVCGSYPERKKGFLLLQVLNVKLNEIVSTGVVYKATPQDKGLVVNYCPWCGGRPLQMSNKEIKS